MKNINWGLGIATVFGMFVVFIIALVVKAHTYDVDLVSEDYYAREIKFQEQINKMTNAGTLTDPLHWTITAEVLSVEFNTNEKISTGKITLFNPSNSKNDLTEMISLNEKNVHHFKRKKLIPGYYKAQVDWEAGGKKYFIEKILILE